MRTVRSLVRMISVATLAFTTVTAFGQNYPSRPIRIVTTDAGATPDIVARLVAQEVTGPLGQPVVVENYGGGSAPSAENVMRAAPDGYTLLVCANAFVYAPLLQKTVYDPVRDYAPIANLARAPNVMAVPINLGVDSVKDLIALAKAKPGVLNYSSGGTGGSGHLTGELFKSMAGGLNIVRVAYKGSPFALNGLMGGEVQVSFEGPTLVIPLAKAGKLKALAVTTSQPSVLAPGLPTVAATLPGFEAFSIAALFAPANTPAPIITRLNQEFVRGLNQPAVKQKLLDTGLEVTDSSPADLAAWMKSDMARMGKVIKDAGLRVD